MNEPARLSTTASQACPSLPIDPGYSLFSTRNSEPVTVSGWRPTSDASGCRRPRNYFLHQAFSEALTPLYVKRRVLSGLDDGLASAEVCHDALVDLSRKEAFQASDPSHPPPRVINTDQARLYGSAIAGVNKEGILRRRCRHRPVQYVNNIVEQDHRAIKRRVKAKQGFREFHAARRTIQGYEAMHMIRQGQTRWVSGSDVRRQIQFINTLFEVAA